MEKNFEIGDEFKFTLIKSKSKRHKCIYLDKTFIIHSISNHTILYFDNRTNKKCKCRNCSKPDHLSYDPITGQFKPTIGLKSTFEFNINLVRTKLQRQREINLNLLDI